MNDAQLARRFQTDVRFWNRFFFGDFDFPWSKQWEIWESVQKFKRSVVRSAYGIGKSFIAARIALWWLSSHPSSGVITTAPTARQVELVLWEEIRRQYRRTRVELGGRLYEGRPKLKFGDMWYAEGFTTRKRAASEDLGGLFQGLHPEHMLFIGDEAAALEPEVIEGAELITTGAHCRILLIGNATDGSSEFAKKFKTPPPDRPGGWNKMKITALESPNVMAGKNILKRMTAHDWPEDRRITWGEDSPMYQAKVLAEFPEMGTNALIPLSFIERALERYKGWKHGTPEERQKIEAIAPNDGKHLGLDCAREGDDQTVGYKLEGPILERALRMAMSKADQVVGSVGRLIADEHFDDVTIEQDPTGAGIIDFLRANGHKAIHGELPGGTPHDITKFFNRKAELAWKLRQRFVDEENICLDSEDTGSQLSNYQYELTTHRGCEVYKMEKKADMKKRIGRSPDDGDACFYAGARVGIPEGRADTSTSSVAGGDW